MNGGTTARAAFRYQDWCTLYVFLSAYEENSFLHMICENEKLDFECWHKQIYEGYQVKLNPKSLQADEVNAILQFFSSRFRNNLNQAECIFFFNIKPKASLSQLFDRFENKTLQPKIRHGAVEKYIKKALKNLDTSKLSLSYKVFSKEDIEKLVWGYAKTILEQLFKVNFETSLCDIFLSLLKDKIEHISCLEEINERRLFKKDVLEVCKKIKKSFNSADQEGKKRRRRTIELPDDPSYEVIIKKSAVAPVPQPLSTMPPSQDITI